MDTNKVGNLHFHIHSIYSVLFYTLRNILSSRNVFLIEKSYALMKNIVHVYMITISVAYIGGENYML